MPPSRSMRNARSGTGPLPQPVEQTFGWTASSVMNCAERASPRGRRCRHGSRADGTSGAAQLLPRSNPCRGREKSDGSAWPCRGEPRRKPLAALGTKLRAIRGPSFGAALRQANTDGATSRVRWRSGFLDNQLADVGRGWRGRRPVASRWPSRKHPVALRGVRRGRVVRVSV